MKSVSGHLYMFLIWATSSLHRRFSWNRFFTLVSIEDWKWKQ